LLFLLFLFCLGKILLLHLHEFLILFDFLLTFVNFVLDAMFVFTILSVFLEMGKLLLFVSDFFMELLNGFREVFKAFMLSFFGLRLCFSLCTLLSFILFLNFWLFLDQLRLFSNFWSLLFTLLAFDLNSLFFIELTHFLFKMFFSLAYSLLKLLNMLLSRRENLLELSFLIALSFLHEFFDFINVPLMSCKSFFSVIDMFLQFTDFWGSSSSFLESLSKTNKIKVEWVFGHILRLLFNFYGTSIHRLRELSLFNLSNLIFLKFIGLSFDFLINLGIRFNFSFF